MKEKLSLMPQCKWSTAPKFQYKCFLPFKYQHRG